MNAMPDLDPVREALARHINERLKEYDPATTNLPKVEKTLDGAMYQAHFVPCSNQGFSEGINAFLLSLQHKRGSKGSMRVVSSTNGTVITATAEDWNKNLKRLGTADNRVLTEDLAIQELRRRQLPPIIEI